MFAYPWVGYYEGEWRAKRTARGRASEGRSSRVNSHDIPLLSSYGAVSIYISAVYTRE